MGMICGNCFCESLNEQGVCTRCGFHGWENEEKYPLALPAGSILNGRYIIGRVLGQGGFGITYTARDHQTGEIVAIKEFFPDSMVIRMGAATVKPFAGERGENFVYGRDTFLNEARTMAQFIGNPNIVRVYSYFEENGTAYFVMEYVDGQSFQAYIKGNYGRIRWEDALRVVLPVMDALSAVHEKGIIHRDVTPDNIYITKDGVVKLLDFGAARYSLGNVSRSLDVILKHGFAPKEQYKRHGRQGPYTDVYALGATLYYAVTGARPDDAIERQDEDTLPMPSTLGANIGEDQENVILKAMAVNPEDRYQSMADFRAAVMKLGPVLNLPEDKPIDDEPVNDRYIKDKPAEDKLTDDGIEDDGPVPKPKPPKWMIPAGVAAVAVAVLGILISTGAEESLKTVDPQIAVVETKHDVVETIETEENTSKPKEPAATISIPNPDEIQGGNVMAVFRYGYKSDTVWEKEPFWGQTNYTRSEVTSVCFQDTLASVPDGAWDISEAGDGRIIAWMTDGSLTVAANGVIELNPDSSYLFRGFSNLKEIDFGGCVDTSKVNNMSHMFYDCSALTKLDVSSFDTSKVINMCYMFCNCSSLSNLDVSGFDTSNAITMSGLFWGCSSLNELDISGFDTSQATDLGGLFQGCSSLAELDVSGFDTSSVTDMAWMFSNCSSLQKLDVKGFDTSNVETMRAAFEGCTSLKKLDVSSFNTSKVKEMNHLFDGCAKVAALDVSGFDTSNVTDMAWMFSDCASLTKLNVSGFDTSEVEDMGGMFSGCDSIEKLDVSKFDTSNVESFDLMFMGCSSLTELDVSNFNTSKATSMNKMFSSCEALKTLDLSGFDTSNVTSMLYMFQCCKSLTKLVVSGFDTSNVTDMAWMFQSCPSLKKLNLSSFNTSSVTQMHWMFDGCTALEELDISGFYVSETTKIDYMFAGCEKLNKLKCSDKRILAEYENR